VDVRRIPVPILLALGLGGCSTVSACLSIAATEGGTDISTTGPCLQPPDVGPCLDPFTTGSCLAEGPCLDPDTTTGPCLGIATSEDSGSSGSSTETGTGSTDTGTETGTGEDSSTTTARSDVLKRLLDRGVLPDDIAARLERPTKKA
jgi:hypothetical protein